MLRPSSSAAQVVDDRMVPRGVVRVSAWPTFSVWDARFGDPWNGGSSRVSLGAVLDQSDALGLFPGIDPWLEDLRTLSGDADYVPVLGGTTGMVSQDVTRIDLGLDLGIIDGWTVGATLPRVKNRTAVSLVFAPDTLAGDLGISPRLGQSGAVDAFLTQLEDRAMVTRERADGLCGAGDPACASATSLADEAELLRTSFEHAYSGVPFFPLAGSSVAANLAARVTGFDAELQAAGLAALTAPLVLADSRPSESDLVGLPTLFAALGYAAPLTGRPELWGVGDVEVRTLLRVLRLGDRGGDVPPWTVDVLAGGTVRLGTGSAPDADVAFSLGTGDGQTDVEARLSGHATVGRRLSVRAGGRYGWQGARTLLQRVPDEDAVLVPSANRVLGEWRPGRYWGVEVEPGLRLARELTLSATYRLWRKSGDVFVPEGGTALDGPGASAQRLGAALEYDVSPLGSTGLPMRLRIRWLRTVSGGGGARASTRVEVAAELFRGLWGGG